MAYKTCILMWILQLGRVFTDEAVDECGFPLCPRRFINLMAEGLYTDASHRAEQASLALKGTFKPKTRETVHWYAGLPADSECELYSVSFRVKWSEQVTISASTFHSDLFDTVTSVQPTNENDWEGFLDIQLPRRVQTLRLDILTAAARRKKAQLQSVRVVVCCQTGEHCDAIPVNAEVAGFFLTSAPPAAASQLFSEEGVWAPGVSTTISLRAGVENNALCGLDTVQFEFRNSSKARVKERLQNGLSRTLRVLRVPSDVDAEQWLNTGLLRHSQDIQELELELMSGDGSTPALRSLRIAFCCQSAPPPCTIVQQNDESDELVITATVNQAAARDALFGSDTCWQSGSTDIEYWDASLPADSTCSIYSVQYEVANTYELYVAVKRFSDTAPLGLQEIMHPEDAPGGVEWWRSGVFTFNQGSHFMNVQEVSLEIWAGQNITELVMPKMRNVKVILCCEQAFSLPVAP